MKRIRILNALLLALAILIIASCEFLPHPMNFVPVTAAAIFAGLYLDRRVAVLMPLASLFVADLFQGVSWIDVPFVYGSVAIAAVWAGQLKGRQSNLKTFVPKVAGVTLGSSVIFFVVTNFGVWIMQDMYSKDWTGLVQCYVMALPFFKNALAGDLLFSCVFVGTYEIVSRGLHVWADAGTAHVVQK